MQTSNHTQTTQSKIALNSLLLFVLLSSVASRAGDAAGNGAIIVPFEAEERLAPTGPPERVWVSDDGIQHTRNAPVAGIVWGDINGTITILGNRNLDLATGHGAAHAEAVVDVEWNGLTGTFEGRSQWKLEAFRIVDGQFIGHGTGDFEGMLMQAHFFNDSGRVPFTGTILIPGDD